MRSAWRRGEISKSKPREQVVKVFSRAADRRDATFYQTEWLVRFSRRIPSLGIEKDEYCQVAATDRNRNEVPLLGAEGREGERIVWNPPREVGASNKRATEIFKTAEVDLAPKEPVRWARNSAEEYGLINGQTLRTVRVEEHTTTFATQDGREVVADHRSFGGRHWEHAYASTIYSSQGRTAHTVLVNADSDVGELFAQTAFVVAIGRQTHDIQLYTDDTERLAKTLRRHLGQKTSAIEALERSSLVERVLARQEAQRAPAAEAPMPERAPGARSLDR